MPEEKSSLPFKVQSGEGLSKGKVSRVWEYDDKRVIKEVTQRGAVNSGEALIQNKKDYEFLKKRLNKHIPKTHFVRGPNSEGQPTNFIVQEKVAGKPISKLSDDELNDQQVRQNVKELMEQCLTMWEETGRLPDLLGNTKAVLLGPRHSPNIMIDNQTKECYLADTDANPNIFSNKAPLIYRARTYLSAWNLRRYVRKLNN